MEHLETESLDKKTLIRIITRAKNLLIKNKWVRNSFAINQQGAPTDPYDPNACGFCLEGAVIRAKHEIDDHIGSHLITDFTDHYILGITENNYSSLISYNDSHVTTKKEAVETLKNMAEHYKKE